MTGDRHRFAAMLCLLWWPVGAVAFVFLLAAIVTGARDWERRSEEAGAVPIATTPEGAKVYRVYDRASSRWRTFAVGADGSVAPAR